MLGDEEWREEENVIYNTPVGEYKGQQKTVEMVIQNF